MGKELVISGNRHETKLAILEDDQLVEIYLQRSNEYSLAGSVHKGRVTRVLPGMQSAFVDIGLERDAFLYVSDFFDENEEYDKIEEKPARGGRQEQAPPPPPKAEPAAAEVIAPPVVERAAAPAPQEEEGDRGDRRNRRSRRRRSRGRGFPESKYASDLGAARPEEEEPAAVEEAPAASSAEEFAVLPGESLAKYRQAPEPGEEGTEAGEEAFEPAAEEEIVALEEVFSEEPEPPAGEFADQIEPDAPLSGEEEEGPALEEPDAEQPAESEAAQEALADEPAPVAGSPESISAEPATPEGGIAVEEQVEMAVDSEPVVDEDLAASAEPATEAAGSEEAAAEPKEEVEPARMPVSLTATLRERGDRYMHHRVSRRMRRKMRGGFREEGTEQRDERQNEPAPVVEERPAQTEAHRGPRPERTNGGQPLITDLLKEGQEIIVQIAKEPLGQKGARITSHIALPGRYVVYMPTVEHMGVSRKISSDDERLRLKRILQAHRAGMPGGFIVRTAGEGKTEDEISSDMKFLGNLWQDIRRKAESRPAPQLLHHDLDLVQRILRDQMTDTFKSVWVDNEDTYQSVLSFVQRFQPAAVHRVKLYTRPAPIFDAFNITAELEKALRPKVWLKSGGYIVINQTEALVAIDVNTGKFVGKSNRLEDTIVKTNTEAIKEIVRQVRLRDLGGIIVVDFIDMDERKNRQKVMQALEDAMRSDRAPNKILAFNDFGLVAITRKRVKQSLERTLCAPCPYCEGAGYVKSVQTVVSEILQEAQKLAKAIEGNDVMLRVNPDVAKLLKSTDNKYLEELEEILKRPVLVKSDPLLHQEKFDLA